jgi:hypothetical protein
MATKGWAEASAGDKKWSYGAELETADWDQGLNNGYWRTDLDWTMVNSDGIAVDPSGKVYRLGGELLAWPSNTHTGVASQLMDMLNKFANMSVNYRSNLHVHVRVPGLRDNLELLKRTQKFCSDWLPRLLPVIEPIPQPRRFDYPEISAWKGARKRFARRKISHQRIMPEAIVVRQLMAGTPKQFFEEEALSGGKLYWATRPRCAVNLRQLLATDTVEFRHFPGTVNPEELVTAIRWCRDFLRLAFDGGDPIRLWESGYRGKVWPSFRPYVHVLEEGYQRTCVHYVGLEAARKAIQEIKGK